MIFHHLDAARPACNQPATREFLDAGPGSVGADDRNGSALERGGKRREVTECRRAHMVAQASRWPWWLVAQCVGVCRGPVQANRVASSMRYVSRVSSEVISG